jgi:cysteinyl-tRNA synthetase
MGIKVYNTLTRQKEDLVTLQPGEVKMYVCGPNLYGPVHVGHAMSYVIFDNIRRYLQYRGYRVRHVQNFTDIEDRIIETARSLSISVQDLAEQYIARFYSEMDALNILRADSNPRATEVIPKILEIVQGLVEKGYAYAIDGDVYFRVTRFPDYGKLSKRSLDQMEAGARIEVDERKEHPMDFALWKAAKAGEPTWPSPWGLGRPGWHIECSAMSMQFLGDQLDIHGGGHDVIFPHHENEIAQAEAATGKPFVRFWIHNGFVNIDHEKMSKSLGNILAIRDLLQDHQSEALRLFLLANHYRSPVDFSLQNMVEARASLDRFYYALQEIEAFLTHNTEAPAGSGPGASRENLQRQGKVFRGHGRRFQHGFGPGFSP